MRVHNPFICGVGAVLYGLLLGLLDASKFKSPTFDIEFEVMPRHVWAVLFIVAGVLAVVWPSWQSAALLSATFGGWVIGIVRAVVTGAATGPSGWVPWLMVISMLLTTYWRHGVDR